MLLDMLYKLLRKSLNRKLYEMVRHCPLGRAGSYERESTYEAIVSHYCEQGISFADKTVIEIGPGRQGYTAKRMLSAGARRVILVEPLFDADMPVLPDVKKNSRKAVADMVEGSLLRFGNLDEIPVSFNHTIDVICSHFVLEHFHHLPSFFANARRLLSENGQCYSLVDLTDHTYHIFAGHAVTRWLFERHALDHLRYSNREYQALCDERTFTNRLLLPAYLELADTYRLKAKIVEIRNFSGTCRPHDDVLERCNSRNQDLLRVTHFGLMLTPMPAEVPVASAPQKNRAVRFRVPPVPALSQGLRL